MSRQQVQPPNSAASSRASGASRPQCPYYPCSTMAGAAGVRQRVAAASTATHLALQSADMGPGCAPQMDRRESLQLCRCHCRAGRAGGGKVVWRWVSSPAKPGGAGGRPSPQPPHSTQSDDVAARRGSRTPTALKGGQQIIGLPRLPIPPSRALVRGQRQVSSQRRCLAGRGGRWARATHLWLAKKSLPLRRRDSSRTQNAEGPSEPWNARPVVCVGGGGWGVGEGGQSGTNALKSQKQRKQGRNSGQRYWREAPQLPHPPWAPGAGLKHKYRPPAALVQAAHRSIFFIGFAGCVRGVGGGAGQRGRGGAGCRRALAGLNLRPGPPLGDETFNITNSQAQVTAEKLAAAAAAAQAAALGSGAGPSAHPPSRRQPDALASRGST